MMRAALLTGPRTHKIINAAIPKPGPGEVLVKVRLCGLCSSELETWESGILEGYDYLGHEVVGTVEDLAEGVTGLSIGDRVTGVMHGGFAEYAKAPCQMLVKISDKLTDEEAVGEPLGCLVSGAERTPVSIGDRVAIVGGGYMGLGFMQLMIQKGAGPVTVIDTRRDALENALCFGANTVLMPGEVAGDMLVPIGSRMGGGFEVVAEAAGKAKALELASKIVAMHGHLSIVGYHQGGLREIDMCEWNWKAFSVLNAHERRKDKLVEAIRRGFALVESGRINTAKFVTHSFELEELDRGLEALTSKAPGYIKGIIRMK